jgi:hypothetical protein
MAVRDQAAPGDAGASGRPREVLRLRPFALFWSATTIRAFGGAIAGVAFQVLIVTVVNATPVEISILSALGVGATAGALAAGGSGLVSSTAYRNSPKQIADNVSQDAVWGMITGPAVPAWLAGFGG